MKVESSEQSFCNVFASCYEAFADGFSVELQKICLIFFDVRTCYPAIKYLYLHKFHSFYKKENYFQYIQQPQLFSLRNGQHNANEIRSGS